MNEYRSSAYDILETMERYGGSFIVQLSRLYRLADHENQAKLESVFHNYFQKYDEMFILMKERKVNK